MAAVQVNIINNSDQAVSLTMDDQRDSERIEYLQTLKRRGDIAEVEVVKSKSTRSQQKPSGDAGGTGNDG